MCSTNRYQRRGALDRVNVSYALPRMIKIAERNLPANEHSLPVARYCISLFQRPANSPRANRSKGGEKHNGRLAALCVARRITFPRPFARSSFLVTRSLKRSAFFLQPPTFAGAFVPRAGARRISSLDKRRRFVPLSWTEWQAARDHRSIQIYGTDGRCTLLCWKL